MRRGCGGSQEYLEGTSGNILVTTGEQRTGELYQADRLPERIFARVLSVGDVAVKCEELGIRGHHLICMQGPFSVEMNLAMLREYKISYLVTKESGIAGGYPQKCEGSSHGRRWPGGDRKAPAGKRE